jgi:hypothetical protein
MALEWADYIKRESCMSSRKQEDKFTGNNTFWYVMALQQERKGGEDG